MVYTLSRQCHTSSQSFITVGSPWPTLQPRMGQCNFLHLWHQKLYRAFRFGTLWPISCSYPRHSQLTRHSLMLANGRIRQSLTALVCDFFILLFLTFNRKLWEVVPNHEIWLHSSRPWEMIWKNIHFIWFSHFTESHWCWKYSLLSYFITNSFSTSLCWPPDWHWNCL